MPSVLILGTLSNGLAELAAQATKAGVLVKLAEKPQAAMATLRQCAIETVFCAAGSDIAALSQALRAERIVTKVVAAGRDMDGEAAQAAMRSGAADVLTLPADPDLLAALCGAAAPQASGPVVRDPAMLALVRRAEQIAASDASVLITGESGTGKEVLARLIHRHSRRARGPFVAVNCAAIPENLLESELFGHEKGAFSGAVSRRLGKFEAANDGTLLLDEVSEMDIRLQAKLLRAIQEREIDRVGGTGPVRVNARILATSNRDLVAEAGAGRFREDLYFRLNVVSLQVPPLRDRPADIAELAAHFARHYAALNGMPNRPLSPSAMLRLTTHGWRGNVRELENTLHRAVLLADGPTIGEAAIELSQDTSATRLAGAAGFVGRRMDDVERDHILQTLCHTEGNRTHAATMLGISIRALRNKLKDYAQSGVAVPPPHTAPLATPHTAAHAGAAA